MKKLFEIGAMVAVVLMIAGCATVKETNTWKTYGPDGKTVVQEVVQVIEKKESLLKDKEIKVNADALLLEVITAFDLSTMNMTPTFKGYCGEVNTEMNPTKKMSCERLEIRRNPFTNYMTKFSYEKRSNENGVVLPSSVSIKVDGLTGETNPVTGVTLPDIPVVPQLPATPEKAENK